jgi:hypothetical protein
MLVKKASSNFIDNAKASSVEKANKISEISGDPKGIEGAIFTLASKTAKFVNKTVFPESRTRDYNHLQNLKTNRLRISRPEVKIEAVEAKLASTEGIQSIITVAKSHLEDVEDEDVANQRYFAEVLPQNIEAKNGNCDVNAMTTAILIDDSLRQLMSQDGFPAHRVEKLKVSVADNRKADGDHAVCLVQGKIDGNEFNLLVDSWADGAVIKLEDANRYYKDHPSVYCSEHTAYFKIDKRETKVVTDPDVVKLVIGKINETHGVDFSSGSPFQ